MMRAHTYSPQKHIRITRPLSSSHLIEDQGTITDPDFALAKGVKASHPGALSLTLESSRSADLISCEQDCQDFELLNLKHLNKAGTTVFSQIWMEWVVSRPSIEAMVSIDDQYPPLTNSKLQELIVKYPLFTTYLLGLPSLSHLKGVAFKDRRESGYKYVFRQSFISELKKKRRASLDFRASKQGA